MAKKDKNIRSARALEEEYFRDHPEEIEAYIDEIFEDYAIDGKAAPLLASLRTIAKVKGISHLAQLTGMSRQGIQHALSPSGNPRFENINAIMRGLGYCLIPKAIDGAIENAPASFEDRGV